MPKNRLNPLPPSAQAITVYGIDVPKLNADHFVSYKAAPVKIQYADGAVHPLSTNLSFFNDSLHIKLKDVIIEHAGTAIKTGAIKGRHIVTAWNPANSTFSIDAKASLTPHLEAVLEGNPNVDLATQSPADSSKLVLLRLKITISNEIHTTAKSNVGKQNDDAYFFFHIPHQMTLDAGYYTLPFAKHFRRFGLVLNGELSITVTKCDGGKRVQRTTKPDHPTNETEKRNHLHPAKQELRGGLIKNEEFLAERLGGADLQALSLGGSKFFVKICAPFLKEHYICGNRNCYKFLPGCPFGNGFLPVNKICNCNDTPAASSNGASSSNGAAQRRLERQKRMRDQQKMIPPGW